MELPSQFTVFRIGEQEKRKEPGHAIKSDWLSGSYKRFSSVSLDEFRAAAKIRRSQVARQ